MSEGPAPDTSDLRTGAPLNDALLALLPLVGVWHGGGVGVVGATGVEFAYGQYVSISHDGRPFLAYESRSWLVDARRHGHPAGVARVRLLAPRRG